MEQAPDPPLADDFNMFLNSNYINNVWRWRWNRIFDLFDGK